MNLFLLDDGRLRVGWRFAFVVPVIVLMNFAAGMLAATFAGEHPRVEDLLYRCFLMLLLLGIFVAMTKLFDQPEGNIWAYLGLPRANWLRQATSGALLGFVLIFLAVIVVAVFFNYQIVKILLKPRTLEIPFIIVPTLLAGAMAEELSFRGYPFQRLVEAVGKTGAILVLSALFGTVHLLNPHIADSLAVHIFAFCNTLLIGVVFAISYLKTKALWFPFGLHFSWNLTMGLIFGLPVSGITEFSVLVRARTRGPDWFLGGGYGLEGGMLGTIVMLLGLAYVLVFLAPARPETPASHLDERSGEGIKTGETA